MKPDSNHSISLGNLISCSCNLALVELKKMNGEHLPIEAEQRIIIKSNRNLNSFDII
jgi:hypothetical protein